MTKHIDRVETYEEVKLHNHVELLPITADELKGLREAHDELVNRLYESMLIPRHML